jgi:hypothetical protein
MATLSEMLVEIPLKKLKKAPWNYKRDDAELAEKLKANINRNGQLENIVVRELRGGSYEIVNGNHRYDAMKDLGFEYVTCANLGSIELDAAQRIAIELNETRFESDGQRLSELMVGLVRKFGKDDVLDTSPFNAMVLDTMIDPSLFLPPSDSQQGGWASGGTKHEKLETPFTFTLRFHERDLIDWMRHLKMLREGYAVERNEEALLALVRSFAPTCYEKSETFQKVVGLLPPLVQASLKGVEANISERLEEDDRSLHEDPHLRLGQIIEILCAEYMASFGS